MKQPTVSISSTESFQARAQKGEASRVMLWLFLLVCLLLSTILRRMSGGVVMADDGVFFPALTVLAVGILVQVILTVKLQQAIRRAVLLPQWVATIAMWLDFALVASFLIILQARSPRGIIPALSAPAMLLLPLLILTSVLRLRPLSTLILGISAAVLHWALAFRALAITSAPRNEYPVTMSYGVVIVLTGIAGMLVAKTMRSHVREGIDEAVAREAADARNTMVQRDLAVARDIQRGLLPVGAPEFPGFDIAGFSRAADLTGGDYYDWQLLPDGQLIVALADVSGHGIGPAMVMAVCRAYARASVGIIQDPSDLMVKLNQLLHGDLPGNRFITFALAMVRPSGHVRLLSAGHGPTLLYRARTGEVEQFGGDGLPLGVDFDEPYTPAIEIQLTEGDVLVMLTDGFFEWHRPGDEEEFGIQRLVESLQQHAHEDSKHIIDNMDQAIRAFVNGAAQQDDMTAVVIKAGSMARE